VVIAWEVVVELTWTQEVLADHVVLVPEGRLVHEQSDTHWQSRFIRSFFLLCSMLYFFNTTTSVFFSISFTRFRSGSLK
jgi:hypothetical protein